MNKKILGFFVTVIALAMFAVPVMAKPTQTPIEYFKEVEEVISMVSGSAGESDVYHIKVSERRGSIHNGTDNTGDKLFTFTQWGSAMMNRKQDRAVWHVYMIWVSTTVDGGFKGKLNGLNPVSSVYTVSGVLNGYGELKGQKLTIEMTRDPPYSAYITGFFETL